MNRFEKEIADLKLKNNNRKLRTIIRQEQKEVKFNNQSYINLSSNDYLALGSDKQLLKEFYSKSNEENLINNYGLGSTSSRLLTGNFSNYFELENTIAKAYKSETSLVFNSGYHANIGILPALTTKKDLILSDKLNHASIVDGIKLSSADCIRYKHLDCDQLEHILETKRQNYEHVFIITESIFSMDGDIANLKKLIDLKEQFNAFLYVDEAHALGTEGENGFGISEKLNIEKEIDLIVGTFGKAFASQGAFVACSNIFKEYLVNKMRSLIFTTSLPPVSVNWNKFIFSKISNYKEKRQNLKLVSNYLRKKIEELGYKTCGNSNIIPIIIGDNENTIILAEYLQRKGYLVFPIRPPTVPKGESRLRISLTSDFTLNDIDTFIDCISKFKS